MNITTLLRATALLAVPALVFIVQCGGEQKTAEAPSSMPSAEPPSDQVPALDGGAAQSPQGTDIATGTGDNTPPAPKPETLNDAQIAAITDAANTAEIAQAKVAQAKSKDAGVKTFAAMMLTHHSQAKQKQAKLKLKTEESGIATAMHADADATLNTLKTDTGKDFDLAYISAQIAGHQKVLDTINDKLLPNVKDASLKAYLEEIKPTVEEHLKRAKLLQQNFDSKSSSTGVVSKHAG